MNETHECNIISHVIIFYGLKFQGSNESSIMNTRKQPRKTDSL